MDFQSSSFIGRHCMLMLLLFTTVFVNKFTSGVDDNDHYYDFREQDGGNNNNINNNHHHNNKPPPSSSSSSSSSSASSPANPPPRPPLTTSNNNNNNNPPSQLPPLQGAPAVRGVSLSDDVSSSSRRWRWCYICSGKFPDRECELYPKHVTRGPGKMNCTRSFCTSYIRYKPKSYLVIQDDDGKAVTTRPLAPNDFDVTSIARECEDFSRGNTCLMGGDDMGITCYGTCATDFCNDDIRRPSWEHFKKARNTAQPPPPLPGSLDGEPGPRVNDKEKGDGMKPGGGSGSGVPADNIKPMSQVGSNEHDDYSPRRGGQEFGSGPGDSRGRFDYEQFGAGPGGSRDRTGGNFDGPGARGMEKEGMGSHGAGGGGPPFGHPPDGMGPEGGADPRDHQPPPPHPSMGAGGPPFSGVGPGPSMGAHPGMNELGPPSGNSTKPGGGIDAGKPLGAGGEVSKSKGKIPSGVMSSADVTSWNGVTVLATLLNVALTSALVVVAV